MARRALVAFLLTAAALGTAAAAAPAGQPATLPRPRPQSPPPDSSQAGALAQDALGNNLRAAEHSGDARAIVGALLDLARFHREQGRVRLALDYGRLALAAAQAAGVRELLDRSWEEVIAGQERAGDAAGALASYRRFKEEHDRAVAAEERKRLELVEGKYLDERKASEDERARREAAVLATAADRRRLQLNLLGGAAILLALIGFTIYRRRAQATRMTRELAITDPLTGLKNRRYMLLTMGGDIAVAQRKRRNAPFGVRPSDADLVYLLIDLDRFKSVNDEFGHEAGDTVLMQTADVLRESCRASDTIARWGGDEFLLVSRFSDRRTGSVLAERIRTAIEAREFELGDGRAVRRTCSIGFASFPFSIAHPDILTWEQVVAVADQALHRAKSTGANKWMGVSTSETATEPQLRPRTGNSLEQWIQDGTVTTETR
jgi:diguanylate cyclase (GGDEF)-like protein